MKKEDFNSEWQFVKGYVPSLRQEMKTRKTEVLQDFIREAYTPILKRFRCRRSGKKKR